MQITTPSHSPWWPHGSCSPTYSSGPKQSLPSAVCAEQNSIQRAGIPGHPSCAAPTLTACTSGMCGFHEQRSSPGRLPSKGTAIPKGGVSILHRALLLSLYSLFSVSGNLRCGSLYEFTPQTPVYTERPCDCIQQSQLQAPAPALHFRCH